MDREERVRKAIELLNPTDKVDAHRHLIWAIDYVEETRRQNQHLKDLYSADARQALDDFQIALKNAAVRYKRLPDGMKQTIGNLLVQRGHLSSAFDDVVKVTTSVCNERLRRRSKSVCWAKCGSGCMEYFWFVRNGGPSLNRRRKVAQTRRVSRWVQSQLLRTLQKLP
jgi:hypothetical protein